MSDADWTEVDHLITGALHAGDPELTAVLARNRESGLPAIDVSEPQGKLLQLLVRMCGARRILEVGTLGGYSTIWLARAVPRDGKVVTLELDPHHAGVSRANFQSAGLADVIELREGPALTSLVALEREKPEPFDLIFIDADKPNNVNYLTSAMRMSRKGTIIVCDNVIRGGAVLDSSGNDPNVVGARAALSFIGNHPDLDGTAIQTVGSKGYDGFAIAIVR